jgi:endonuclease/exonuclease/phosphatase (EEP) superfamily protein YafD
VLVTGNSSRLRQTLGLVDGLDLLDRLSGFRSAVVGGDFNTWSTREAALRRMRRLFPDSPDPLGEPTRGSFATDHVFYRRSPDPGSPERLVTGSYRRIGSAYYSDHHPITVRLALASR